MNIFRLMQACTHHKQTVMMTLVHDDQWTLRVYMLLPVNEADAFQSAASAAQSSVAHLVSECFFLCSTANATHYIHFMHDNTE